jgi:uncharacterized protein (TIGR00369 family)
VPPRASRNSPQPSLVSCEETHYEIGFPKRVGSEGKRFADLGRQRASVENNVESIGYHSRFPLLMAKIYDLYRERLAATGPWGLAATLGMTIDHFEPGLARVSMSASPPTHNPGGTLHGGVYCDLADMAMGVAFFSSLAEGEAMTTLELKINFLRPVVEGPITAEARVIHRGKTTGLVECDVRDAQNRLLARASSTCFVLTGERAEPVFRAMTSWK